MAMSGALMLMTTPRKRTDHRTTPHGGTFGSYLLGGYLLDQDWAGSGQELVPQQMHETKRNASGFVHLEGGKPAMRRAWVNHLSGIPRQAVARAIEMVRTIDPDAIAALDYYQTPDARRQSRYTWAMDKGITEQTISDWFRRAVRKVREHLPLAVKEWEAREGA